VTPAREAIHSIIISIRNSLLSPLYKIAIESFGKHLLTVEQPSASRRLISDWYCSVVAFAAKAAEKKRAAAARVNCILNGLIESVLLKRRRVWLID
jgi:hypothetical protein